MRNTIYMFVVAVIASGWLVGAAPIRHFAGNSWWSHVRVLADDNMEGRGMGSAGLDRAEAYVVEQLKAAGLEPAGTDGFYQRVPFIQREIDESQSFASLIREGVATPIDLGGEAILNSKIDALAGEISASLVFIGNGLRVPEHNLDELAGLDVKGKVVVHISGSPDFISAALTGHYGTTSERWKMLREAGAIGLITVANPASMDVPWIRVAANRGRPTLDLDDPGFNEIAGLRVMIGFNPAQAEKLFVGSGHTFRELAILAKERKVLPRFPLAVSLKARMAVRESRLESRNVLARLPGSDAKLKDEFVVLSAHIDHLGTGAPINGDKIYNGAMDDASGCALLLDLAANLRATREPLRRSLLLAFVVAEERGLLGSKYFVSHPTVPLRAARGWGVNPIADPEPLRNSFVRSDQYSFIQRGIPAVKMDYGALPGTPEHQIYKDWLTERYHAPSDDLSQPVDLAAASTYEEIIRTLAVDLANAGGRPQWMPDSFFRRYADK